MSPAEIVIDNNVPLTFNICGVYDKDGVPLTYPRVRIIFSPYDIVIIYDDESYLSESYDLNVVNELCVSWLGRNYPGCIIKEDDLVCNGEFEDPDNIIAP